MKTTARILVIDASREIPGYYQHWLQAEGYDVEIATFPEMAQEEVEQWHPDLIASDLVVDAVQEQQTWQLIWQFNASPVLIPFLLLICAVTLILPGFLSYVQGQQVPFLRRRRAGI